jgi:hypothetical protein
MMKDNFARLFVPVLLCLVALTQIYFSHTQNLTPWKGGGFGMFASIDRMERRVIQITAVTEQKKFVINPEMIIANQNEYSRFQSMPSRKKLQEIHEIVQEKKWVVDSTNVMPELYHETLYEMGYGIYPLRPVSAESEVMPVIKNVRVAVKTMRFHKENKVIEIRDLMSYEE